jgi:hypothetical protein
MNRAGDFHRARLIRGWPSAIGIAPDLVISHSLRLPPGFIFPDRLVGAEQHRGKELRNVSPLRSFPMRASFSRSEYYDRTDTCDRHEGVLTFAFCRKPPTFTKTDSVRLVGWRLAQAPNSSAAPLAHVYSHVSYTGYYMAEGLLLAG